MPRILVVDDDAASVSGMTQLLTGDGHHVCPRAGGSGAIDAMSSESFDVVVTDLEMPHVDGQAVVRAARERQPHACVVVTTARAHEQLAELLDAGACFVSDKPLDYETLLRAIEECRSRGGPEAEGSCHMRSRAQGHRLVRCYRSR
jgi:CheY-like chemotaxis protein